MIKEVGGRLLLYAKEWHTIKPDIWVESVVTKGYKIEFTATPPIRKMVYKTPLPINKVQRDTLLEEVKALLLKKAIYPIFPPFEVGFWSTFFLAPKKTGDWRPILNLKSLNKYIKPKRFRMESLAIVLKAPIRSRWATSIDLKDAYLHIPINQDHQRWLRFHIKDQAYAFRCLPFGLSTAPRVFTRVVKAVGAFLRRQGVQIHFYLDDWLITSQSLVMAHRHTELVLRTLARLGFIVNLKKSPSPANSVSYFPGSQTGSSSRKSISFSRKNLQPDRVCKNIQSSRICSSSSLVETSRFNGEYGGAGAMVQVQNETHPAPSTLPLQTKFTSSVETSSSFSHCPSRTGLVGNGEQPFSRQSFSSSPASARCYNGCFKEGVGRSSQDLQSERSLVSRSVSPSYQCSGAPSSVQFTQSSGASDRHIREENSNQIRQFDSCVVYKQTGRDKISYPLSSHQTSTDMVYPTGNFSHSCTHPGNRQHSSRQSVTGSVSESHGVVSSPQIVQTIFERVGIFPTMDLFATRHNKQTQVFCSRTWDEKAFAIDALSISWNRMTAYAFPPISLIYKVIQKIQEEDCVIILVAPFGHGNLGFKR